MTLQQAKQEATRRWHAHGGWAEERTHNGRRYFAVGVRVLQGHFNHQVTMGMAGTWARAFQAADRFEQRDRQPARSKRTRDPDTLDLPL